MTLILPFVESKAAPLARVNWAELGLPCVTDVPDAASLIRRGARVTVDGYLGIVTVAAVPEQ